MAFQLTGQQQPGLQTSATQSMVPQPVQPPISPAPPTTGYNVQVPDVIPSPVYDSQLTNEDVFNKRNQFQNQIDTKQNNQFALQSLYQQLMQGNSTGLVQRPQTDATTMRQQLLDEIASKTQGFAGNYQSNIQDAYSNAGVNQANDNLSNIQEQIGNRQVQQRQDIRALQDSPFRSVSRNFADDRRNTINAQANAELADLAIQEIAASGRYDRALEIANAEIDQQGTAFEQSIAAYQSQLDALQPTLDQEDQLFANTLRFQLDEVKAQAAQERDNQKTVVETAMEAASQGAPQDLVRQIANAQSPAEATALASQYLGLQDRLNSEAQRANIWSQIRERNAKGAVNTDAVAKKAPDVERNSKTVVEAIAKVKGSGFTGAYGTPELGTAGVGSLLKFVPGTEQRNLSAAISTIKANLGFDELQAMRDASPTGGALGQVSEKEIEFLQATIANLDQGQSPEQLKKNLSQVFDYFELWANDNGFLIAPDGTLVEITD